MRKLGMSMVPLASELLRLQDCADAMGSTFSIVLYGSEPETMKKAVSAAFDELCRLDEMLSMFRPESEWSKVNRCAAKQEVRVSAEMYQLLSRCMEYSRQSEGAFDISAGPLKKIWGLVRGSGRIPSQREIDSAAAVVGYQHVKLDPNKLTVRYDRKGVEIDPGGIGKGYAVDRMIAVLKYHGCDKALVTASSSSIRGLGSPPGHPRGWQVGICDPGSPRKFIAEVFLKNSSISTSGSYRKCFHAGGKAYCHIMDPRTGYPAHGTLLVSVAADCAIDSEVWTKACFVNGRQWAASHKPDNVEVFFGEDVINPTYGWI